MLHGPKEPDGPQEIMVFPVSASIKVMRPSPLPAATTVSSGEKQALVIDSTCQSVLKVCSAFNRVSNPSNEQASNATRLAVTSIFREYRSSTGWELGDTLHT